jgi:hypothetical protein
MLDADPAGVSQYVYWRRIGVASLVGAFSHLFFDFISHGNFLWFYPWYEDAHFFPAWWYTKWFEIPLPGYRNPYPAGPHLVVWLFLSLLGIWLLFRGKGKKEIRDK